MKELSDLQIANKIKAGNDFHVRTATERKKALAAAKFLGIEIITKAQHGGKFLIYIPSDVPN